MEGRPQAQCHLHYRTSSILDISDNQILVQEAIGAPKRKGSLKFKLKCMRKHEIVVGNYTYWLFFVHQNSKEIASD